VSAPAPDIGPISAGAEDGTCQARPVTPHIAYPDPAWPGPDDLLDVGMWLALSTHHAHLAESRGVVRRYRPEVARFATFDPAIGVPDDAAWADLAGLVGPGGVALLTWGGAAVEPPTPWTTLGNGQGIQMVLADADRLEAGAASAATSAPTIRDLTDADVPAMVALVALTEPGPFQDRTIEMGRYLGVFDGDRLVAMAGERMHPPGFTEISAVCTHPDARGRGLASALVGSVAAAIRERGETPFLNVSAQNPARSLYEHLGFEEQRRFTFRAEQFG
jgi:GNAT superfamily N-acetyltransferase